MRKRVRVIWTEQLGWCVDLPTYSMVPDTFEPTQKGIVDANGIHHKIKPDDDRVKDVTVEVEVPDEYCHPETGELHAPAIKRMYRGNPLWAGSKRKYNW